MLVIFLFLLTGFDTVCLLLLLLRLLLLRVPVGAVVVVVENVAGFTCVL